MTLCFKFGKFATEIYRLKAIFSGADIYIRIQRKLLSHKEGENEKQVIHRRFVYTSRGNYHIREEVHFLRCSYTRRNFLFKGKRLNVRIMRSLLKMCSNSGAFHNLYPCTLV